MDNEENILFEQMSDVQLDWGRNQNRENIGTEKEYDSLYDEMIEKCNPGRFTLEGNKFSVANEIYAQLRGGSFPDESELRSLRNRAIDELGLYFSTAKIFRQLQIILDPNNYTQREPYDRELVENAGSLFVKLQQIRDDIRELEQLESLPLTASILDEYDFQNLTAEEYIIKHPNGKYVESAKQQLYDKELNFAKGHPYNEYLLAYPNGFFSDEAHFYKLHKPSEYLREYPNGLWKSDAENEKEYTIAVVVFGVVILIIIAVVLLISKISFKHLD